MARLAEALQLGHMDSLRLPTFRAYCVAGTGYTKGLSKEA